MAGKTLLQHKLVSFTHSEAESAMAYPFQQAFAQMLQSLASAPEILALLYEHKRELAALREEMARKAATSTDADGWLDAKAAAEYLSLSPGTFDKYRYSSAVKINGYKVGGKTLYKRGDLDLFVKLFELKSNGFA